LTNYIKIDLFIQNPLPDLRQQYINNNHDSLRRCQSTLSNEERPSTQNTSMTSMSDFELNYINMTRTSLFSPSVYSLPTESVQYTTDHLLPSTHDSILMRAYSVQESQKFSNHNFS
jgi:hypothetical protein